MVIRRSFESDPDSVSPSRLDLGFEWDLDSGKQLGVISRGRVESSVTGSETDLTIRIEGGRGGRGRVGVLDMVRLGVNQMMKMRVMNTLATNPIRKEIEESLLRG